MKKKTSPTGSHLAQAEAKAEKGVTTGHVKGELPPTPEDEQLSLKHHADSIQYNLHHATDHFGATADHLARLAEQGQDTVARQQAKKAQKALDKMQAELAPYLK